jgi:hypothetical protein
MISPATKRGGRSYPGAAYLRRARGKARGHKVPDGLLEVLGSQRRGVVLEDGDGGELRGPEVHPPLPVGDDLCGVAGVEADAVLGVPHGDGGGQEGLGRLLAALQHAGEVPQQDLQPQGACLAARQAAAAAAAATALHTHYCVLLDCNKCEGGGRR